MATEKSRKRASRPKPAEGVRGKRSQKPSTAKTPRKKKARRAKPAETGHEQRSQKPSTAKTPRKKKARRAKPAETGHEQRSQKPSAAKTPRKKKARHAKPAETGYKKRSRKPSVAKTPRQKTGHVEPVDTGRGERLQKVLAAAGLGSRRDCEEIILAGRVDVDGQVVSELGTRVDLTNQRVRVDGDVIRPPRRIWYAVHKPTGVVCTNRDPAGRPRAVDLVPSESQRLFVVGRLDITSEGLLLLTNDGDLANQLTHPRYGVQKTYRVMVAGEVEPELLSRLRKGIHLAEGLAKVSQIRIRRRYKRNTILEMVLEEGRNREIRRVLARVGHKVMQLVRVAIGPVRLGNLAPGESRQLARKEVEALRRAVRRTPA